MCSSSKPPDPVAPPPPTPQRDTVIEARQRTQDMAKRAARSSYGSTIVADADEGSAATVGKLGT